MNDNTVQKCEHCNNSHSGPCPRVKAIEYHENGAVKRVEYTDQMANNDNTQRDVFVTNEWTGHVTK